jgi:hypothetical protein
VRTSVGDSEGHPCQSRGVAIDRAGARPPGETPARLLPLGQEVHGPIQRRVVTAGCGERYHRKRRGIRIADTRPWPGEHPIPAVGAGLSEQEVHGFPRGGRAGARLGDQPQGLGEGIRGVAVCGAVGKAPIGRLQGAQIRDEVVATEGARVLVHGYGQEGGLGDRAGIELLRAETRAEIVIQGAGDGLGGGPGRAGARAGGEQAEHGVHGQPEVGLIGAGIVEDMVARHELADDEVRGPRRRAGARSRRRGAGGHGVRGRSAEPRRGAEPR